MSLNNFHYYEEEGILAGFVLQFTINDTISYDDLKEGGVGINKYRYDFLSGKGGGYINITK